MNFLSVDNIAFTVLDYPMSYVELIGTILYLWSVWLIARRNILTWPVGIISVLLYMVLFYQIRLYADTAEQVYYLFASIYGWWVWRKTPAETDTSAAPVHYSTRRSIIIAAGVTLILTLVTSAFLSQAHVLIPEVFPEPASYPFLDALTTIMSFTAMWLMARKCTESWIYWIIVDVIGIGLYYTKDVRFIALLYVILLGMAVSGLISWHRNSRQAPVQTANHATT